jgi:hypothetical protein
MKNEERRKRWRLCVAITLLTMTVVCQAEIITIGIKARVNWVDDRAGYLEGAIAQNDILTGYYVFDSLTPDSNPSGSVGIYEYDISPFGMWVSSASGLTFGTNPAEVQFSIRIANGSNDAYIVSPVEAGGSLLPLPNGTVVNEMFWQLNDYTGTALSSDALPLTPPVLEHWNDINHLYISGGPRDTKFMIGARVIETWIIPEPAAVLLLACGILLTRRSVR